MKYFVFDISKFVVSILRIIFRSRIHSALRMRIMITVLQFEHLNHISVCEAGHSKTDHLQLISGVRL